MLSVAIMAGVIGHPMIKMGAIPYPRLIFGWAESAPSNSSYFSGRAAAVWGGFQ